jgi:hypothetical protein
MTYHETYHEFLDTHPDFHKSDLVSSHASATYNLERRAVLFSRLTQYQGWPDDWTGEACARANEEVIQEELVDYYDACFWRRGYLGVDLDAADAADALNEVLEFIGALENYPVLDDMRMSEIEWELWQDESDWIIADALNDALHSEDLADYIADRAHDFAIGEHGLTVAQVVQDACRMCGEFYVDKRTIEKIRRGVLDVLEVEHGSPVDIVSEWWVSQGGTALQGDEIGDILVNADRRVGVDLLYFAETGEHDIGEYLLDIIAGELGADCEETRDAFNSPCKPIRQVRLRLKRSKPIS